VVTLVLGIHFGQNVNLQNQFWRDKVDKFLQAIPKELEMAKIKLKYFAAV
jgi:hypothetical protein